MRRHTAPSCTSLVCLGVVAFAAMLYGCGGKSAASGPCDCDGGAVGQDVGGETSCETDKDCDAPRPYCSPDRDACVECRTGRECSEGLECIAGACLASTACKSSRDCPEPLVCSDARQCVECVSRAECPQGQRCVRNACRSECESDRECVPEGLLCDRDLGRCVECLSGDDCGRGRTCLDGRCRAASDTSRGGVGAGAEPGQAGEGPPSPQGGETASGGRGADGGDIEAGGGTAAGGSTAGHDLCGNRVIDEDEACDDGNGADGDGCSSSCRIEAGFHCASTDPGATLTLPVVYRDFRASGDFEPTWADGVYTPMMELVATTLDIDGKPTFAGDDWTGHVMGKTTFSEWYRDVPGYNSSFATTLTLWKSGDAYVNRWGDHGEKWSMTQEVSCGPVGNEVDGRPCTNQSASTPCEAFAASAILSCEEKEGEWYATVRGLEYDGNPVFFPLDNVDDMVTPTSEYANAVVPPAWGGGWRADPSGKSHNFHFTSEIRFRFRFDVNTSYALGIMGDDDIWVFINQALAMDLGGIHTPVSGELELKSNGSSSTTVVPTEAKDSVYLQIADLGLEGGQEYEVALFQAERKKRSSSFLVKMTGFDLAPTQCVRR